MTKTCPICTLPMDDPDGGCIRHEPAEILAWEMAHAPMKPCPFCGTVPKMERETDEYGQTWDKITCPKCFAGVMRALNKDGSGSDVLERWNRRDCPYVVFEPVLDELRRAMAKFPSWPNDRLHALAVLGEEFGELTKAVLQATYEPHKNPPEAVRTEAVQTAAMALRFLLSLAVYESPKSAQHGQVMP